MSSLCIQIGVFLALALFAFGANYALSAISYAVAALRFAASDYPSDKNGLSAGQQKLVASSKKVGTFCVLGIRFFLLVAVFCIFFALMAAFELASVQIFFWTYMLFAFLSVCATIFIHFAICDLPAAASAARSPSAALKRFYRPYLAFYFCALPFEFLSRYISEKIFGSRVSEDGASFDHIDVQVKLRAEEEDSDELTPYAQKIVRNSIRLNELEITDVMIPRNIVQFLDTNDTLGENLEHARKAGHTRYPLCDSNLDNCIGVVHIKDVFRVMEKGETLDLMSIKRGVIRVKHDDDLIGALSKLRRHELHMAFVEDGFGGIIGILTLDGILEEIVGQIKEDHDDYANEISRLGKNAYRVSGLAAIHNVEDFLDVDFDNDDVSTFGGLITQTLGRFPEKGEKLFISELNMRIVVEEVAARRVLTCKVEILDEDAG